MKKVSIPKELQKKFITLEWEQFAVMPIHMTDFAKYIIQKIGTNYVCQAEDIIFLNYANTYWNKKEDKASCIKAIDTLLEKNIGIHADAHELILDAFS